MGKGKTALWAGGDPKLSLTGLCLGMALTPAGHHSQVSSGPWVAQLLSLGPSYSLAYSQA